MNEKRRPLDVEAWMTSLMGPEQSLRWGMNPGDFSEDLPTEATGSGLPCPRFIQFLIHHDYVLKSLFEKYNRTITMEFLYEGLAMLSFMRNEAVTELVKVHQRRIDPMVILCKSEEEYERICQGLSDIRKASQSGGSDDSSPGTSEG